MTPEHKYTNTTHITHSVDETLISFTPDPSGTPVSFQGTLKESIPFREAFSTFHQLIQSGKKEKPHPHQTKDELNRQLKLLSILQAAQPDDRSGRLEEIRQQLLDIREEKKQIMAPLEEAKKKYTGYLSQQERESASYPGLLFTVEPETIQFEYFNQAASLYGKLTCHKEAFKTIREVRCGTTVPDYTAPFYEQLQRIRNYKETTLRIDSSAFNGDTTRDDILKTVPSCFEINWLRGFLQMNTATGLPAEILSLHPAHLLNLCCMAGNPSKDAGAHALHFLLTPGHPIRIRIEATGKEITCHGNLYTGESPKSIRVWGGEKLAFLSRLIPSTQSCKVILPGTGMPFFILLDTGAITLTTGISGWDINDWQHAGHANLLLPNDPDKDNSTLITRLQSGKAIYDPITGTYADRQLTPGFPDTEQVRFSSDEEKEAYQLAEYEIELAYKVIEETLHIEADMNDGKWIYSSLAILNKDLALVGGRCHCDHYRKDKLKNGPCRHILSARIAFEKRDKNKEI